MASRGRSRGFTPRGRGWRGGRNFHQQYEQGPPEFVVELGHFLHPCEGDLVCRCTNEKIPYFNAPVYLENKSQIGKVDDIFGPMNEFYFSVKLQSDMQAASFKENQKFFIDPAKLLPLARFLPKPPGAPVGRGRGRGGGFFTPRGGRGRGRGRGGGFGQGGRGGSFRGWGGGRGRGWGRGSR